MSEPIIVTEKLEKRFGELVVSDARAAAEVLRKLPEVDEVAFYGHVLRLATLGGADPEVLGARVAKERGLSVESSRPARATVEDAFVSMVRSDHRAEAA